MRMYCESDVFSLWFTVVNPSFHSTYRRLAYISFHTPGWCRATFPLSQGLCPEVFRLTRWNSCLDRTYNLCDAPKRCFVQVKSSETMGLRLWIIVKMHHFRSTFYTQDVLILYWFTDDQEYQEILKSKGDNFDILYSSLNNPIEGYKNKIFRITHAIKDKISVLNLIPSELIIPRQILL